MAMTGLGETRGAVRSELIGQIWVTGDSDAVEHTAITSGAGRTRQRNEGLIAWIALVPIGRMKRTRGGAAGVNLT